MPEMLTFEVAGNAAIPERLLATSRSEAAAVGYAHGWSQGLREARESLLAEQVAAATEHREFIDARDFNFRAALGSLVKAADQLEQAAVPTIEQNENAIIAAAVEIAEALLGLQLQDRGVAGRAAIARSLRLTPSGEKVVVRLNPLVLAAIMDEGLQTVLASVSEAAGHEVVLEADATLAPGDAMARCGATTIDARLSAGVQRVKQHVAG